VQATLQVLAVQGLGYLLLIATVALAPAAALAREALVLAAATGIIGAALVLLARWARARPEQGASWVRRNVALAVLPAVALLLVAAVALIH